MRIVICSLVALAGLAAGLVAPNGAAAQSRLTLFGGGLVPFGDLEEVSDPSLRIGARIEYQPVNARGKRRLNSWFLQASWTPLELKAEVKEALEEAGESTNTDLLVVEAGARIYTRAAPLFLQVGAGWGRYQPPGDPPVEDLLDLHVGAGFLIPIPLLYLEAEASLHEALGAGDFSFPYITASAGVSLPF